MPSRVASSATPRSSSPAPVADVAQPSEPLAAVDQRRRGPAAPRGAAASARDRRRSAGRRRPARSPRRRRPPPPAAARRRGATCRCPPRRRRRRRSRGPGCPSRAAASPRAARRARRRDRRAARRGPRCGAPGPVGSDGVAGQGLGHALHRLGAGGTRGRSGRPAGPAPRRTRPGCRARPAPRGGPPRSPRTRRGRRWARSRNTTPLWAATRASSGTPRSAASRSESLPIARSSSSDALHRPVHVVLVGLREPERGQDPVTAEGDDRSLVAVLEDGSGTGPGSRRAPSGTPRAPCGPTARWSRRGRRTPP